MRAARLFEYNKPLRFVELNDPNSQKSTDVVVKVAGSGVCRTDLHIMQGEFDRAFGEHLRLPFTLGHESVGYVESVGSEVSLFKKGDPVIVYPQQSCGLCRACRAGNDMHCSDSHFLGIDGTDGGFAEYLKTSVRSIIKLKNGKDIASLAPLADAGITVYHAVKKIMPISYPGSTAVVIGVGGLGHLAVQILKLMTTSNVIAVDTKAERAKLAEELGADHSIVYESDAQFEREVRSFTGAEGVNFALDFVGEKSTPRLALKMLARGGVYSIIGYGGEFSTATMNMVTRELSIQGNLVGSYNELSELVELSAKKVKILWESFKLDQVNEVLDSLSKGNVLGRAILIP